MGSSGSGKTNTAEYIRLSQTQQRIHSLDDVAIGNLSRNELAQLRNHKIGLVFRAYNLLARTSTWKMWNCHCSIIPMYLHGNAETMQ